MSRLLVLRNEQKTRTVNMRVVRKITLYLLTDLLAEELFELGFHFVGASRMAVVNETFLQHTGSTDVITFDYAEKDSSGLHGEIFISVDDAISQAKEFGTTWQSELIRYVVHAILHLQGYDDLQPAARKKMKAEENRLVDLLTRHFKLNTVGR